MARRRKPEEAAVQEAPVEMEASASFEEELAPEPEPKPESETKRPKDAVLGYMRERYGHY